MLLKILTKNGEIEIACITDHASFEPVCLNVWGSLLYL